MKKKLFVDYFGLELIVDSFDDDETTTWWSYYTGWRCFYLFRPQSVTILTIVCPDNTSTILWSVFLWILNFQWWIKTVITIQRYSSIIQTSFHQKSVSSGTPGIRQMEFLMNLSQISVGNHVDLAQISFWTCFSPTFMNLLRISRKNRQGSLIESSGVLLITF